MNRIFTLTLLFLLTLGAFAQPSAVQKTSKSVFTLTTFKADGSINSTSHGVYFGNKGEAISTFTPFVGAASAVIIDGAGKKYDVVSMIGADEMYDICRFRVSNQNSTPLLPATGKASEQLWCVGYSVKKPVITSVTMKNEEKFLEQFTYYTFKEEINEDNEGCPILNDAGEIVGLAQRSSMNYDIHSTDAKYYNELITNGLSTRSSTMKKTGIRISLPNDHDQAKIMLMMMGQDVSQEEIDQIVEDYIRTYPTDADGYVAKARNSINRHDWGDYKEAVTILDNAEKKVENKDELFSEYAEIIYNIVATQPDSVSGIWTYDDAEAKINQAIALNPQPGYTHQLAQITYSKGDYQRAFDLFLDVTKSLPTSEVFFECAQCKSHLNAEPQEVIALLDSAVTKARPLSHVSAPYVLARGMVYDNMGELKMAMKDYNLYDSLMYFNAREDFYYTRYQCEKKLRQYQQALNDIAHASYLNPTEPTYLAELAALQLQVGRFEDALTACELCEKLTTEYSDVYIVKGIALARLERKSEALAAFIRAKELNDERADALIEKYK